MQLLAPPRVALAAVLAVLTGSSGGAQTFTATPQGGGRPARAPSPAPALDLVEVSSGFGVLVPHRIHQLDALGQPTNVQVEIRDLATLLDNATATNPVLPWVPWPPTPALPGGDAGNHYLVLELSDAIEIDSVLDASPAGGANSGLTGAVSVTAVNPTTGQVVQVAGRAFVGGKTYAGTPSGSPPKLELQAWVRLQGGLPVPDPAIDNDGDGFPDGLGFPGTQSVSFHSAAQVLSPRSFVFVPDADGDLKTHETFPSGYQIRLRATSAVRSAHRQSLARTVVGSATVGPDTLRPEVSFGPTGPLIEPGNGSVGVDPATAIRIQFSEPLQPLALGSLPTGVYPAPSNAVAVSFGPPQKRTLVPFTVAPPSVYDFTRWELTPAFAFPGLGPVNPFGCPLNQVLVEVLAGGPQDLSGLASALAVASAFETGPGPGLVNAPVAPDAIYVARGGAQAALSVLDLNGFGQSTGDPTFDFTYQTFPKGSSNFPNNPNLRLQGSLLRPPLSPGTCTIDGGSAGVFTLTRDSNLDDRLIGAPQLGAVGDMAIGQPLDLVRYDSPEPGGCLAGGGNLCATTGLKVVDAVFGAGARSVEPANAPGVSGPPANLVPGAGNPISWSPHPNPPPLIFPPLCQQPFIGGQEPTSYLSLVAPPVGGGLTNLLVPGDPFGDPLSGIPPSGLLAALQNTWFEAPDLPGKPLAACQPYMLRQQLGHFLYVADALRQEVVVLDSNRLQVLERIALPDPTELAMGPNLDLLAVTSRASDAVHFIDIHPASATFHQVVQIVAVGDAPRGIAWDPGNEDVLVCNEGDDSVSVISAFSLTVRQTVTGFLDRPFDVAITQRQAGFGTQRNVYFAWILNRSGELALYESGPAGLSGWGYDDAIGLAPMTFVDPQRIAPDFIHLEGGVWIAHRVPLDAGGQPTGVPGGALTNARVVSSLTGMVPLTPANAGTPQFRGMTIAVDPSIDESQLTGLPVDLAQDDQINLGILPNLASVFSAGAPALINGKSLVRQVPGQVVPAKAPRYLLVAVPSSSEGPGVLDVIDLVTGLRVDTDRHTTGTQSIPAAGVTGLADYWRP